MVGDFNIDIANENFYSKILITIITRHGYLQ